MVSGCIGGSAFGSWRRRELKTNYRLVEIVCQLQQYPFPPRAFPVEVQSSSVGMAVLRGWWFTRPFGLGV